MADAPATLAGLFALPSGPGTKAGQKFADGVLAGKDGKQVYKSLKKTPGVTPAAAQGEVAKAASALLDISLTDVLLGGWRTLAALHKLGKQSRAAPGKPFELALGRHQIASRHKPSLEVFVNGKLVATIPFEAVLAFKIGTAVLVIRDGKITAIRSATFHVQGTFSCRSVVLASVKSRKLKLPVVHTFKPGIEIPK